MSDAPTGSPAFWDERYRQPDFVFGTAPNDFLAAQAAALEGPVLSLGEGEGRNAVFLASRGLEVTGVDLSALGLEKARALAARQGVSLTLLQGDLSSFDLGQARWGAVVSIFCHLPSALRRDVHRRVVAALRPGGRFLLEHYTPRQLAFSSGGPRDVDLLPEPALLRDEVAGLQVEHLVELEREVNEGARHTGRAAVVQLLARKP